MAFSSEFDLLWEGRSEYARREEGGVSVQEGRGEEGRTREQEGNTRSMTNLHSPPLIEETAAIEATHGL